MKEEESREALGIRVREVWVEYCKEIGKSKPSHIAPWEELKEESKEADRRIGAALWGDGFKDGLEYGIKLGNIRSKDDLERMGGINF